MPVLATRSLEELLVLGPGLDRTRADNAPDTWLWDMVGFVKRNGVGVTGVEVVPGGQGVMEREEGNFTFAGRVKSGGGGKE